MKEKKPNVILMLIDDLGVGDISCFNKDGKIDTKNINKLANNGMKFEDSHSSCSLCTPSRYSLLTGRYNWRSRLKSNVLPGDSETLIEHDRKTIGNLFKENGYNTAAVGKWHLGLDWVYKGYEDYEAYDIIPENYPEKINSKELYGRNGNFDGNYDSYIVEGIDIDYSKKIKYGPNQFGFDYFFGTPASLDQPPFVYIENDHVLQVPTKITGVPNVDRFDGREQDQWQLGVIADNFSHKDCPNIMQDKVIELIDKYSKEANPFFIYYPCHLIHGPILPDDKEKGKSPIGRYGDVVLQVDRYVGEIVDKLNKNNIFEDTIFIFTSDNGASGIADFPKLEKLGHNPSGIYRGHKMDIWEGGHREPTIISYPKMIAAGTVANQMVCHSDFYATFAELLGSEIDDDTAEDSFSNLSIWKGGKEEVRHDIISSSGNGGLSIRTEEWKLNLVKDGGHNFKAPLFYGPYELFNIKDDVREQHNVIDKNPEIVKNLMKLMEKYIEEGRTTPGKKRENDRNNPTGEWKSISWMEDYPKYIEQYKN